MKKLNMKTITIFITLIVMVVVGVACAQDRSGIRFVSQLERNNVWYSANNVVVRNQLAYISASWGMLIVDISDPANPQEIAFNDLVGARIFSIELSEDRAFVADLGGVRVVDISDDEHPELIGSFNLHRPAHDIKVVGDIAYVAGWDDGLRVLDVSNPEDIREIGSFDTQSLAYSVAIQGNILYLAEQDRLRALDISNPARPRSIGTLERTAVSVTVIDDHAFVSANSRDFRIIDISDPTNMREIATLQTPGNPEGFQITGRYCFLTDGEAGLRIIDISDINHPREVGYYDTDGDAWAVAVVGDIAVVADYYSIDLYDCSEVVGQLRWIDQPPESISVSESDIVLFNISYQEADNVQLAFSSPDLPESVTFEDNGDGSGTFNWQTTYGDAGNYTAIFTLSDGEHEITAEIPIEVKELFHIDLAEGWNLISSVVPPEDPNMEVVWRDLVERDNIGLVKDESGWFYAPAFDYNGMGDWDVRQGYQACVIQPDTLIILGDPVDPETVITLCNAWSFVAYFPSQLQLVQDAFANISDYLQLVKNDFGQFYAPEFGFSNMMPLRRGRGYQVNISRPCELIWNIPEGEQLASRLPPLEENAFRPTLPTYQNMSLLVQLPKAQDGNVQAVDASGNIVGEGVIDGDGRCGVAVWGDDDLTAEREGLTAGEAFSLKLVDENSEVLPLDVSNILAGDGLVYQTDSFVAIDAMVAAVIPTELSLSAAYPNPFNAVTRLTYGLPLAGRVSLSVFDIAGRQVTTLFNGDQTAGMHSVSWNAEGMPSGLYIVRMSTVRANLDAKVLLMK